MIKIPAALLEQKKCIEMDEFRLKGADEIF